MGVETGVQEANCVAQPIPQEDFLVRLALGRSFAGREAGAVHCVVAKLCEVLQCGQFDDVLVESAPS